MKYSLMLGAALLLAPGLAAAQTIVGSAHDFSGVGWNSGGEICVTCHTPHNGDATVTDSPLWNHEVTTATYTLYASSTLNAVLGQPAGVSKLCLSCHDGTVALDSFGGTTGGTVISGSALFGTILSNDHPISFTYDGTLATADGSLHDPAATVSGLGGNIDADMLFGAGNDQVECSSCHDVHGTGNSSLLHVSNVGSALCMTCHDK